MIGRGMTAAMVAMGSAAIISLQAPAAVVAAHGVQDTERPFACPANAKPAKLNYTLKDLANKPVKMTSFKGKVVLLDFWATWCGPCKLEIPWFVEFQKQYGRDGLAIVGVSVDDKLEALKPYAAQMRMNYPILQGLGHDDLLDAYGPMDAVPTSVMISRDGRVCAKHTGLTGRDQFEREIKALLAAPPAP